MQNEELLNEISRRVASGELDAAAVMQRLGQQNPNVLTSGSASKAAGHMSVTKVLYLLGTAVLLLGIVFLVAQIWEDIGAAGRILVTLFLGFLFALLGSYLLKTKAESQLGSIFHIVGGCLIPSGALVALNEMGAFDSLWLRALAIGLVFAFYLLLNTYHKNQVLTFFTVANGTAFIYLLAGAFMNSLFYPDTGAYYAYLTMAIGLGYLLLSKAFRGTWNNDLVGVLNFFGSAAVLGGAFSRVFDSGLWQLLFFVLAVGGMAFAIQGRSKSILTVSTLFLIAHFTYITNEYFANSIGWPVSLVILGCVIIGLGYFSISLSKKYIGEASGR